MPWQPPFWLQTCLVKPCENRVAFRCDAARVPGGVHRGQARDPQERGARVGEGGKPDGRSDDPRARPAEALQRRRALQGGHEVDAARPRAVRARVGHEHQGQRGQASEAVEGGGGRCRLEGQPRRLPPPSRRLQGPTLAQARRECDWIDGVADCAQPHRKARPAHASSARSSYARAHSPR